MNARQYIEQWLLDAQADTSVFGPSTVGYAERVIYLRDLIEHHQTYGAMWPVGGRFTRHFRRRQYGEACMGCSQPGVDGGSCYPVFRAAQLLCGYRGDFLDTKDPTIVRKVCMAESPDGWFCGRYTDHPTPHTWENVSLSRDELLARLPSRTPLLDMLDRSTIAIQFRVLPTHDPIHPTTIHVLNVSGGGTLSPVAHVAQSADGAFTMYLMVIR